MNNEIVSFLKTALECSVLIEPLNPALTIQELSEIGKRAGYQDGEINDALPHVAKAYFGVRKLPPSSQETQLWAFSPGPAKVENRETGCERHLGRAFGHSRRASEGPRRNTDPFASAHPCRAYGVRLPAGPPDIRPDEARDAKGTAEQVVRAILDWLSGNGWTVGAG
jgi:hypothetical protein